MSRTYEEILRKVVQGSQQVTCDRYLDPPPIIDFIFSSTPGQEIELEVIYPRPVESYYFRIPRRALGESGSHALSALRDYINDQLHVELADFNHRSDRKLLELVFRECLYSGRDPNPRAERHFREVYQYYCEQVDQYHTEAARLPRASRPFFSLRDPNEELPRWQEFIARRANVRGGRSFANSLSYWHQDTFPEEVILDWYWQQDQSNIVAARRDQLHRKLRQEFLEAPDFNYWREQHRVLDQIDRERIDLFRTMAQRRARSSQNLEEVWYGRRSPGGTRGRGASNMVRYEEIQRLISRRPAPDIPAEQLHALERAMARYLDQQFLGAFEGDPPERITIRRGQEPFGFWTHVGIDPARNSGRSPEAEERGMKLLQEHLTKKQWDQFQKEHKFYVFGGKTGDKYEIRRAYQLNVVRIRGNKREGLCFVPRGTYCLGDTLLTQKLGLELDEEEMLRVARPFNA